MNPKCGPVLGGTELVIVVDIDSHLTPYLFNLCVGFQARNESISAGKAKKQSIEEKKESKKDEKREDSHKDDLDTSKSILRKPSKMGMITPKSSKFGAGGTQTGQFSTGYPVNALAPTEQQIEQDVWHCSTATYELGRITCQ